MNAMVQDDESNEKELTIGVALVNDFWLNCDIKKKTTTQRNRQREKSSPQTVQLRNARRQHRVTLERKSQIPKEKERGKEPQTTNTAKHKKCRFHKSRIESLYCLPCRT